MCPAPGDNMVPVRFQPIPHPSPAFTIFAQSTVVSSLEIINIVNTGNQKLQDFKVWVVQVLLFTCIYNIVFII